MQKFTGDWGSRGMFLFWTMICAFGLIFFGTTPPNHKDATYYAFVGVMLLLAGGQGALALWGLVELFTTYGIDADSITRKGWNGAKRMAWSDVTHFEGEGGESSQLTLTDYQGNKLRIQRGLIEKTSLYELNRLLNKHLAPVCERQLSEIGGINNIYHPKRGLTGAGIIMVTVVGGMLIFVCMQPVRPGEQAAFVLVVLFMGSMLLLFVYGLILALTQYLMFTPDGITEGSVFRTRHIPFHAITSVTSQTVHTQHTHYDQTTIEGDGQKIKLTSHAKDYEQLTAFIRRNVDTAAKR